MKEALDRLATAIDVLSDPTATALVRREDLILVTSAVNQRSLPTVGDMVDYDSKRYLVVEASEGQLFLWDGDQGEWVYDGGVIIVKYATDETLAWIREQEFFDEETDQVQLKEFLRC